VFIVEHVMCHVSNLQSVTSYTYKVLCVKHVE